MTRHSLTTLAFVSALGLAAPTASQAQPIKVDKFDIEGLRPKLTSGNASQRAGPTTGRSVVLEARALELQRATVLRNSPPNAVGDSVRCFRLDFQRDGHQMADGAERLNGFTIGAIPPASEQPA